MDIAWRLGYYFHNGPKVERDMVFFFLRNKVDNEGGLRRSVEPNVRRYIFFEKRNAPCVSGKHMIVNSPLIRVSARIKE
jgi:hypothetical protein